MSFFNTYLSGPVSDALGWTIFHSLWQGMLIGLLALIILRIRNKASAQFRYLVGIISLTAILAASLFTFYLEYQPGTGMEGGFAILQNDLFNASGLSTGMAMNTGRLNYLQQALSESFPWMTTIWLLGVFILSVRLAGGLFLVHQLRSRDVSPLPNHWADRFRILVQNSGIRRTLRFRLSTRVTVPMVIGVLKPVVLIPAGIISLMPVEQIEAVIVHEIAHIRRYDFLINIFQSLIEALFFYHPVVWLLSSHMRQEREKCCDDYAVSVSGRLSIYARALAGLGEFQAHAVIPAVALSGNKNRVIHRVERLINPKKMKNNASEKIIAGLLILGSAIIMTLSTGAGPSLKFDLKSLEKNSSDIPAEPAIPARPALPDSLHGDELRNMDIKDNIVTQEFITKDGTEKSMKFVIREGEVKELYVDGKKIPESDHSKYQKEIDQTMKDLQEMEAELRDARQELEDIDWEEMKQLQQERFYIQIDQEYMQKKLQEEMTRAMEEMKINKKEMQKKIEKAMQEIEFINQEELTARIEKEIQAIQDIDFEMIRGKIDMAMKEPIYIGFAEMKKDIRESMKHMELEKINMDEELQNIDELIEELEKLELEK